MVSIFFAILLGSLALQLVSGLCSRHSAIPLYQQFQIVPRPVIYLVAGLRRLWLIAHFVGISLQQKVRHILILGDFKLGADARCSVGMLAAEDDHLLTLPDALPYLFLPVAREGVFHRPIANLEWRVFMF